MNKITGIAVIAITLVMVTAGAALAASANPPPTATHKTVGAKEAKVAAENEQTAVFLKKAAEEYVSSQLTEDISEWRIADISWNINETLPNDFDSFLVVPQRSSKGGEALTLIVEFSKNGRIINRMSVNCKVEMFAQVVVAKERIARGTAISQDMVEMEKKRIDSPIFELCTQIATTVGQVAERNIFPGKAILKSNLSRAMDVKAGDLVMIVAASESIKLTARGIAKKDGTIGEMIPVVNVRSNKKLYAKVVDGGTVEVSF